VGGMSRVIAPLQTPLDRHWPGGAAGSARQEDLRAAMLRVQRVHFVGIGGVGMCGIAEVMHHLGFVVTGSDQKDSARLQRLRNLGIPVALGHAAQQVEGADVVVVSSAISIQNPEVAAALAQGTPVVRRAEMLAELMRFSQGIAVAGTHGKTTTTSLIAALLTAGGQDPTWVIGGKLMRAGTHARLGAGRVLVAEADESDASFLHLLPMLAVVTNIDADHLEAYGGDVQRLEQAFVEFMQRLPFYGRAIVCSDDAGVQRVLTQVSRPLIRYGLEQGADVRAVDVRATATGTDFRVVRSEAPDLQVSLALSGEHNVRNALAAIAIASELGVADEDIVRGLAEFEGIARRFESYGAFILPDAQGRSRHVEVIDDYAHHPRELQAVLQAARARWPQRRIVLVFQPHRYTRTRDLFDAFVAVLSQADGLLLLDVYAAGEAMLAGSSTADLLRALRARGEVEPVHATDVTDALTVLPGMLQDQDVVLFCGAGNIGQAAEQWRTALAEVTA
jgi:UDP-N-acetylmuramate--alanine ligase